MKIAPVSADLLIKVAVTAAALGALYYAYSKAKNSLADAADSITSAPGKIYDAVAENVIAGNQAVESYLPQYVKDNGGLLATNLAVLNAVNPASSKNLIYKGVNAIGAGLTGQTQFDLGGWIYDKTH